MLAKMSEIEDSFEQQDSDVIEPTDENLDDEHEDDLDLDPEDEEDAPAPGYGEETEGPEPSTQPVKGRSRRNPLQLLSMLRPSALVKSLRLQSKRLQHLIWSLEDAGTFSAKLAVKAAIKAARPILVWLIIARARQTLQMSADPIVKMAKLPPNQQLDYYYSRLMGKDWEQQMEQDMLDAIKEVEDGYITDEVVREKRKLSAVMLRRMEVEEWDKERMRHFYYGLYGMGPWYWEMEERLHNPYFTGARAWNGPIESWVGENKTFDKDAAPGDVDFRDVALDAINQARGRPLSKRAANTLRQQEELRNVDHVLTSPLFKDVLDPVEVRAKLQEQSQAAAA
eukprot:jgi/Chrzof1/10934/Cz05g17220.t1